MTSCNVCEKPNQGPLCGLCTAIAADRKTARKAPKAKPKKARKERWERVQLLWHQRPEREVWLKGDDWEKMKDSWG